MTAARLDRSNRLPRAHRLRGVKGVTHYAVLIFIGVMALFPMYFMAVSGLRNGIQLQTHPFSLSLAKPSVPSIAKPRG